MKGVSPSRGLGWPHLVCSNPMLTTWQISLELISQRLSKAVSVGPRAWGGGSWEMGGCLRLATSLLVTGQKHRQRCLAPRQIYTSDPLGRSCRITFASSFARSRRGGRQTGCTGGAKHRQTSHSSPLSQQRRAAIYGSLRRSGTSSTSLLGRAPPSSTRTCLWMNEVMMLPLATGLPCNPLEVGGPNLGNWRSPRPRRGGTPSRSRIGTMTCQHRRRLVRLERAWVGDWERVWPGDYRLPTGCRKSSKVQSREQRGDAGESESSHEIGWAQIEGGDSDEDIVDESDQALAALFCQPVCEYCCQAIFSINLIKLRPS